jgi:type IV pilus assembly protein PilY1
VRVVLNSNKQIIGVYAGDLLGRVWKFDLSSTASSGWKLGNAGSPLFTAMNGVTRLPITAAPAVLERTDQASYKPSYLVTVATGKLFESTDPGTTSPTQYAFGLWDKYPFGSTSSMSITNSDLESLNLVASTSSSTTNYYTVAFSSSSVTQIDWTTKLGWMLPLNLNGGQRVIYPVSMVGDVAKIDTVAPLPSVSNCQNTTALGLSLYIDPLYGACLSGGSLDTNGDGVIDASDTPSCALSTQADGMDVVLTILNAKGQETGIYSAQSASDGYIFKGKRPIPPDCTDPAYAAAHPAPAPAGCGAPPTPPNCTNAAYRLANPGICAGATLNRSWRQIFPRAN